MRAVTIGQNEAGQRLDKFLNKYMKEAGVSFFYKMMRKKNIVLNVSGRGNAGKVRGTSCRLQRAKKGGRGGNKRISSGI